MKTFALTLFCFSSAFLSAQAFGTQGTWHYEYRQFGYLYIYEISYEKDSIVKGKTYQALAATGTQYLQTGLNSSQTNAAPKRYFLLHTQNDTVYRLAKDSAEYILYDFSAQMGDSWVIGPADTALGCSGLPTVSVYSTGIDTVNGQTLKYWGVSSANSGAHLIYPAGFIYERIGFLGASRFDLIFEPTWTNCDSSVIAGPDPQLMRCYQDTVVGFINRMPWGSNCDSVPGVSLPEFENHVFSLYPNPAKGQVNLSSTDKQFDEIRLFNLAGQMLIKQKTEATNSISLSHNLPQGYYTIIILHKGLVQGTASLSVN